MSLQPHQVSLRFPHGMRCASRPSDSSLPAKWASRLAPACRLVRPLCAAVACAQLHLAASSAGAAEYEFTLVDAFNPEYDLRECYLYDINDEGVACGTATIRIGSMTTYTGFYWTASAGKTPAPISWPHGISNPGLIAGVTSVFDIPSQQSTTVPLLPSTYQPLILLAVNDAGVAVGSVQICNCSNSAGTLQIPYVWDAAGGARSIDVPNAKGLARINNAGVAIGWTGGNSSLDGFFIDLASGGYTMMNDVIPPTLGFGPTRAYDINDGGAIVGTRYGNYPVYLYGYVWSPESGAVQLPFPGEPYQQAVKPLGINNNGTIVGEIYQLGSARAFVYTAARGVRDLNDSAVVSGIPAGFTLMSAQKINDRGWIVGYGYGGGGMYKSFVLRPSALAGDLNCDGVVNNFDIDPFVLALTDPAAYAAAYPACDIGVADINGDGLVNNFDIDAFVALLTGG